MNNKTLISVIIPTYNRGSLVTAAIDSVLAQTFTDFELIVIDDGSTDDTVKRLRPYEDRIRYFHQANRGASAAQNAGLREATGEWVAILGSDDTWHPAKLECQVAAVRAMGDQFGACFTDCRYKGNEDLSATLFEIAGLKTDADYGPIFRPIRYIMGETYGLCVQSLMVLRSVLNEVGEFDESLVIAEDRDLLFRLTFKTRFCYVSRPLVDIDRTPGRPRLTEFSSQRDDRVYGWHERLLNSMLAHPELVDPEMRSLIQSELAGLYYDWTAAKIMKADVAGSARNVGKLRENGQTRRRILWNLLRRACAKFLRVSRKRE